jgi:hypothetical protein
MQNNRLRLGQLIAFCGGLALLASLSLTWFRPNPRYFGDEPFHGSQTGWEAFRWEDTALGGIALAALALTVAMAFPIRGDAPRALLLVLGLVATSLVVGLGVSPALMSWDSAVAEPPKATQTGAWIALVASLSLLAGAHGIRLGSARSGRNALLLATFADSDVGRSDV